jgi:endonuclease/exonuclease/phosphatase family metal-dependent hydrolase
MTTLRVLSYNVYSLRLSQPDVVRVIRATRPDVVCIQEAPRLWGWRAACVRLALDSGLRIVTGGRPAAAMLLLARPDLTVVARRNVKLPWHPPLHRRGLAIAVFDVDGSEVAVASMHCSLSDEERMGHLRRVLEVMRETGRPYVLAGDVNAQPGEPAWELLTAELQDGYAVAPEGGAMTSTARNPHKRIDGVFVDRRLRVVGCGVPAVPDLERASDHCPVLATVEFPT